MSTYCDVVYHDVEDGVTLNHRLSELATMYISIDHEGLAAANLSKEDALAMAHRIINRFKVEQNG